MYFYVLCWDIMAQKVIVLLDGMWGVYLRGTGFI